jgi:hypothetical protein
MKREYMTVSTHWRRFFSYVLIVMGGVAAALYLGKDLNWDSLNYHVYAGYTAVEDRLTSDYFAASSQGYLNPYSHVPFYLMLKHGFAPQIVVAMLALFHVLNLLIVYEIASRLNKRQNGEIAWVPVYLAVFFAFFNPIFIIEIGSSFNEISTSVPVLAGWYLLIREFGAPRHSRIAIAGVLIGMAVALKLTNLYFSVTALPLLLLSPISWKARAQAVLVFAGAGVLGGVLAGGWWAWQMWEYFGNPFFPLFNNIFHSPDFTDAPLTHYRFIPGSITELLLKPFMMILPKGGIHLETVAPDLRYAALVLLFCLFGLKYVLRRMPIGEWRHWDPFPAFQEQRTLFALTIGVLITWGLWAISSGNSRYFLPMSSLASVILASLLFRFSGKLRFLAYSCVSLVVLQVATITYASDRRWGATGWGKSWFELDIPAEIRQQPSLYLHLGGQSASFLLPFLPQGSSMINVSGQYVLEENARIRALLEKHRGQTRVMRSFPDAFTPGAAYFNFALLRFGMEADMNTCLTIKSLQRFDAPVGDKYVNYISCKTKPLQWSAAQLDDFVAKKRRADAVFDGLEALCPRLLQPRGLPTEGNGGQFWRVYGNTDMALKQNDSGMVSVRNVFTHSEPVEVGTIEALARAMPSKAKLCP